MKRKYPSSSPPSWAAPFPGAGITAYPGRSFPPMAGKACACRVLSGFQPPGQQDRETMTETRL